MSTRQLFIDFRNAAAALEVAYLEAIGASIDGGRLTITRGGVTAELQ